MRSFPCAGAALCLLLCAAPAPAQNSLREPAQPQPQAQVQEQAPAKGPVPMSFGRPEARPGKSATRQAGQAGQPVQADPDGRIGGAGETGEPAGPQSRFPNKDTAKNRQDYEMGTEHGQENLRIDRGEKGGESVVRVTAPKKKQQTPGADMPIEVKVLAPTGRRY